MQLGTKHHKNVCFQSSCSGYKYIFSPYLNWNDAVTLLWEVHLSHVVPEVEQHYHPTGIQSVFFFPFFVFGLFVWLFCFASHQLFRQTSGTVTDYLFDFLHMLAARAISHGSLCGWSGRWWEQRWFALWPPRGSARESILEATGTLQVIYWLCVTGQNYIEPRLNCINIIDIIQLKDVSVHMIHTQLTFSNSGQMDSFFCNCSVYKGLLWMGGQPL